MIFLLCLSLLSKVIQIRITLLALELLRVMVLCGINLRKHMAMEEFVVAA
jgi:hypothetical protein